AVQAAALGSEGIGHEALGAGRRTLMVAARQAGAADVEFAGRALRAQGQWGAEEICELIRAEGVSILGFTPSYGSQLAQWLESQGRQLPVMHMRTGGEALTGEHLQRIRQAFAPASFFNAYGPTETVVMPLACLAPERLEEGAASVPLGSVVGARVAY
ncbi:AMP-binding protein, partial [Pseudomonas aeruginosa]